MTTPTDQLLHGLKVVEFAPMLTGAATGMLLADLGADVVKLEPPGGDPLRYRLGQLAPGVSPAHAQLNRNKRSATIDVTTGEGVERLHAALRWADVVVIGYSWARTRKLGLDPTALSSSTVVCLLSGFGQHGPYALIPARGAAMSGLVGSPAGPGIDGEVAMATAAQAALRVAAAAWRCAVTGKGAVLDVAGSEALLIHTLLPAVYALNDHRITDRTTLPEPTDGRNDPRNARYATRDGRVVAFAASEQRLWDRFVGEFPDADDTDLAALFASRDLAEWTTAAAAKQLPISPAYDTAADAAADPHNQLRGVVTTHDGGEVGEFTYVGHTHAAAPRPGQHTDEFFAALPARRSHHRATVPATVLGGAR